MKIDKIIFTSTERYSDFWNLQAEVWSNMGIEPLLLLWGKKSNTDVSERHGKVLEMTYSSDAIMSLQMTWSKFFHVQSEPNTTWITGDIDLFPLRKSWFIENIVGIEDDCYAHLSATALSSKDLHWHNKGGSVSGGIDLPAYFHAAKGKIFSEIYGMNGDLVDQVNHIVSTGKYGRHIPEEYKSKTPKEIATITGSLKGDHTNIPYWCADENYTSDMLWKAVQEKRVKWKGVGYDLIDWNNPYQSSRIDRYFWTGNNYRFVDMQRLKTNQYIDIHCSVPYISQSDDLIDILRLAGMIQR
jgi:hypothetical protein